ncbi:Fic/DOC family protein [Streptomyces beijiangensis]|uniref:protein adenylyltransferase n=1 Tax=Streptomyces beijiangensis TaxID=163361 RepID=A0A939F4I7_9ACTN|nr:Fic family protein [Streptomyces beijiangensis]MBO0511942.1 Fic family protein [Streptomyces beijiangensis]
MADPYVLPNGTLKNLLGIEDATMLAAAEADITYIRLTELSERPIEGAYDLDHLCRFHARVFGDIYPWAGKLRTVDIAKHTPFCPAVHLHSYASEVFGRLRSADLLRGLGQQHFVHELAEFYGDINALHPFREGNGRAQRAFLQQLASHAGHTLSWEHLDRRRNEEAAIKSFLGDNEPLRIMLAPLVDVRDSGS